MSSAHPLVEGVAGACHSGDVGTLQAILTQHPELDINLSTEGGATLLMHAIIGAGTGANPLGHYLKTCQLLVQAGVYLETADLTYGRTASHWATYYHKEDILAELIIAGCDMTCPDFSGTSPLHLAIEENATTCLTMILQFHPKEILEIPDSKLRVPLVHAVQVSNLEICQILLQGGANVNCIDQTTGRTPLHFAAETANGTMIEFLIRSGGVLDTADASGLTPIHIASIVDSPDALNAIVKVVGSEVLNLPDVRGLTPLMHAGLYGNEGNVRLLLKKKVDTLSRDTEGKSCLHWAAESLLPSAPNCVQLLCKKQKELIDAQDNLLRTPLHMCAIAGNVESMRVLLSLECNVTSVDVEQHSAVHWAAVSGNPDVLALLLDTGCPLDTPDVHGAFPIHYAAQEAREPAHDELYTEEAALQSQNILECLRILIERGAPIDCRDGGGMQPLHWALQFPYNVRACSLLLSHGADPNAKDSEGMTGLHISARHGLVENCQFLFEHTGGIHGNEVDSVGQTALFHAVEGGHVECVEYLLSSGLSPDHRNNEDRTPSHVAATVGSLHCLQILQAYGADFHVKSVHGATPMHEAAANGHADVLEYLISCGCRVSEVAGSSGSTALHYSVSGGHEGCVRVLVQYGADVNPLMTSEEGEQLTPLDYCTDNTEIVDLLRSHGALTGVELSGPAVTTETVEESAPVTGREPSQADQSRLERDREEGEQEEVVQKVLQEDERKAGTEGVAPLEPDRVSVKGFRPPSPSKQSLDSRVFESEDSTPAHVISPRRPSRKSVESTEMKLLEGMSSKPPPHMREMKRQDAKMEIGVGMVGKEETRQKGLLERALSVLKQGKSPPPSGSILSSAIGFYASHATMLAAAVIGTPLGEKTMEVAEKVATDTAEELKKAEAAYERELPDLVWLQEREKKERTPTPVVAMESPPSPSPSPPPVPEIQEDPYERRIRKAKAQMDMSKTPAFRAVEELVRAQNTHMKLRREFEEAKLSEDIAEMKEAFQIEEHMAQHASERVMRRFRDRMQTAETESEQVSDEINRQLRQARDENAKLSDLMGELGVSPRPTVAQWLQQKREQKKAVMQDALISWDRNKQQRDAAILLQQTITSQRALKHAVWGARKDISAKIKVLKDTSVHVKETSDLRFPSKTKSSRLLHRAPQFPKPPPSYHPGPRPHRKTPPRVVSGLPKLPQRGRAVPREKNAPRAKLFTPTSSSSSVRATPHGFLKIRDEDDGVTMAPRSPTRMRVPGVGSPAVDEEMWKMGESYAQGKFIQRRPPTQSFLRATGPKSVHAERTLHFIPPGDYEAMKEARKAVARENWRQELGLVTVRSPRAGGGKSSSLVGRSLDFNVRDASSRGAQKQSGRRRRSSFDGTTVQYHSLADSLGDKGHLSWKPGRVRKQRSADVPVLPMNILDSNHLPEAVMS